MPLIWIEPLQLLDRLEVGQWELLFCSAPCFWERLYLPRICFWPPPVPGRRAPGLEVRPCFEHRHL